ncbi:hypothetical protein [Fodinicola acaciae]|uniref:hypothetical protein n=1 Tax=Fodinicola acaciae TaxID=2681555 RepID=UPI0013D2C9E4|nr:hypothetical protein [Fodinicola acaciae]
MSYERILGSETITGSLRTRPSIPLDVDTSWHPGLRPGRGACHPRQRMDLQRVAANIAAILIFAGQPADSVQSVRSAATTR